MLNETFSEIFKHREYGVCQQAFKREEIFQIPIWRLVRLGEVTPTKLVGPPCRSKYKDNKRWSKRLNLSIIWLFNGVVYLAVAGVSITPSWNFHEVANLGFWISVSPPLNNRRSRNGMISIPKNKVIFILFYKLDSTRAVVALPFSDCICLSLNIPSDISQPKCHFDVSFAVSCFTFILLAFSRNFSYDDTSQKATMNRPRKVTNYWLDQRYRVYRVYQQVLSNSVSVASAHFYYIIIC